MVQQTHRSSQLVADGCAWATACVTNIYFPNIHQNLLALMHLRTYRSFCGGPAVDACMQADAASGARQTARVAAVSALSDCVEICTRFCWRVNCGKSARAARSARAASRSVRAPSGKYCALIGWPACRWEYKRRRNVRSSSLVGGGPGKTDMTDWEPDELRKIYRGRKICKTRKICPLRKICRRRSPDVEKSVEDKSVF